MNAKINTLDLREDFRSGRSPCDKVKNALNNIGQGQTLRLLVPFEPVPLFQLAASKGLGHKSTQTPEGDWEVLFRHDPAAAAAINAPNGREAKACGCDGPVGSEILEVDARGLEPPQPMVRILETLAGLANGATLRARTDRRPVHLYSQLEARGFVAESAEQTDGSFITHIRHA